MNTIHKISYSVICFVAGMLLLTACRKEDVVTGNNAEAYINFYNASEVLKQGMLDLPAPVGGTTKFYLSHQNYIYINDSVARTSNFLPVFAEGFDDKKQFPAHITGIPAVIDGIARAEYNVYWLPLTSGFYRFIYTSAYKNYLVREAVQLDAKTYTTQYLTEDPSTDSAYRVVTAPAYLKATPGSVRVQTVHLSPDSGPVDVFRMNKDGNRQGTAIVQNLAFGNHNDYADIDTAGAATTYGNIVLGFYKAGSTTKLYSVAVAATSGASFITVVQGFAGAAARRIIVNANGYSTVTWQVTPDLRVNVRRLS